MLDGLFMAQAPFDYATPLKVSSFFPPLVLLGTYWDIFVSLWAFDPQEYVCESISIHQDLEGHHTSRVETSFLNFFRFFFVMREPFSEGKKLQIYRQSQGLCWRSSYFEEQSDAHIRDYIYSLRDYAILQYRHSSSIELPFAHLSL